MFFDLVDNPQTAYEQTMSPGQVIVFKIKADCKAAKFLRCEPMTDVSIEGRFDGVGEFVDLTTTGLSVGAFDGERKTFQIRATAAEIWDGVVLENAVFEVKA